MAEAAVHPNVRAAKLQSYAVTLAENAPMSRNDLMQALLDKGIATRRGIMLSHREAPYARGQTLPRSERASDRSVSIPLYPQMTAADQDVVLDALFSLG